MKQLFYLIIAGVALLCHSCQFTHENNGYPPSVSFKKEGGTIRISGDYPMMQIEVDGKGTPVYSPIDNEKDSVCLEYEWLIVKWRIGGRDIYLTAEPNVGKKNRKVKLYGYMGYEYAEITVSQKH